MRYVKQMRLPPNPKLSEVIIAMEAAGVLGAGRLAAAVRIVREMLSSDDYTVFLCLSGPVVPGGLRCIISDLLKRKMLHAVVTNGANIVHDIAEAIGEKHIQGKMQPDDVELFRKGTARIGDVYIKLEAFKRLEKKVHHLLSDITLEEVKLSPSTLLEKIGRKLRDDESILYNAAAVGTPMFSPGILDSMLGLHVWTYKQTRKLELDILADMNKMADIVFEAKKTGAIILGGGIPKHFTLGAVALKGGVDAAIQITLDRPEAGSLSGAPLEEGITWGKAKATGRLVTVISDFTIAFPMIIAGSLR
ncbi:MAG: deoxyhypusine synthase family protein, partial [Candidatus Bathyarchaeia archaeon]